MSAVTLKPPCVLVEPTDFVVGIAKGTAPYHEDSFTKSAENLYQKIIEKGNCTFAHPLDDQEKKEAIAHFYQKYCDLKENTTLKERSSLLNMLFLQTLTNFSESKVTKEQQHHIERHSAPILLKLRDGGIILENKEYSSWFTKCFTGLTSLPMIQKQIDQYRGLRDDDIEKLILSRAQASSSWYNPLYEKGEISLDDVKTLRKILLAISEVNPLILESIRKYSELPEMLVEAKKAALEGYTDEQDVKTLREILLAISEVNPLILESIRKYSELPAMLVEAKKAALEGYTDEQAEETRKAGWAAILQPLDYFIEAESKK
ncbi:MAG: hypothetical protein H7A37_09420 [Chlamydiales bacterium]|nr:hypothetical protein [Chlamydiales bacterium]